MSLFRIGMRTGDVVKGVDGQEYGGPEDAEYFCSALLKAATSRFSSSATGNHANWTSSLNEAHSIVNSSASVSL